MLLVRRRCRNLQEIFFSLPGALSDGRGYIRRELRLQDHVVVQVVFEVLGTLTASMSIVDTEDLELGPLVGRDPWLLILGLNHV